MAQKFWKLAVSGLVKTRLDFTHSGARLSLGLSFNFTSIINLSVQSYPPPCGSLERLPVTL